MSQLLIASGAFSDAGLTALVSGRAPRLRPAPLRRARRARVGARRRAQHRPRGDDADRRLRGLRRRLPRRQRVARLRCGHARRRRRLARSWCSSASAWGLDQIVVGIAITLTCRGRDRAHLRVRVRGEPAAARRDGQGRDPRPRRPPGRRRQGRVEREPLHAAARRLPRPRPDGARRVDAASHAPRPQRPCGRRCPGRPRRGRRQRLLDALVGGALRRRDGRAWRRVPVRSSLPEASRTPSSAVAASSPSSSRCSPAGGRSGS